MRDSLFPLKIAKGDAFCNRTSERTAITQYIKAGHHLWLQAHRRHGKTSLLLQVQQDNIDNNERIILHRIDLAFSGS